MQARRMLDSRPRVRFDSMSSAVSSVPPPAPEDLEDLATYARTPSPTPAFSSTSSPRPTTTTTTTTTTPPTRSVPPGSSLSEDLWRVFTFYALSHFPENPKRVSRRAAMRALCECGLVADDRNDPAGRIWAPSARLMIDKAAEVPHDADRFKVLSATRLPLGASPRGRRRSHGLDFRRFVLLMYRATLRRRGVDLREDGHNNPDTFARAHPLAADALRLEVLPRAPRLPARDDPSFRATLRGLLDPARNPLFYALERVFDAILRYAIDRGAGRRPSSTVWREMPRRLREHLSTRLRWDEFLEYVEHLRLTDLVSLRDVAACFLASGTTHLRRDGVVTLSLSFRQFVEFHLRLGATARGEGSSPETAVWDLFVFLKLQIHRVLYRVGVRLTGYDALEGSNTGGDSFFWKSSDWTDAITAFFRAMDAVDEERRVGVLKLEDAAYARLLEDGA